MTNNFNTYLMRYGSFISAPQFSYGEGDVITPHGLWSTSGMLSPRSCQKVLLGKSFRGHSGHVVEPSQLRSLCSEKRLGIQDFTIFTVAHSVAKRHAVNSSQMR